MSLFDSLQLFTVIQVMLLLLFLSNGKELGRHKVRIMRFAALLILTHMVIEFLRPASEVGLLLRVSCTMTFMYGPIAYVMIMNWEDADISSRQVLPHLMPMFVAFIIWDKASELANLLLSSGLALSYLGYGVFGLSKLIKSANWHNLAKSALAPLMAVHFVGICLVGTLKFAFSLSGVGRNSGIAWLGHIGEWGIALPSSGLLTMLGIALLALTLLALALRTPSAFADNFETIGRAPLSYRDQLNNDERKYLDKLAEEVRDALEVDKAFKNADLTIAELAQMLEAPERDVSRAVNMTFGRKFPILVNELRVAEARNLLADSKCRRLSATDIQFKCGFNTKSNFYRAFREVTGTTPLQYREQFLLDGSDDNRAASPTTNPHADRLDKFLSLVSTYKPHAFLAVIGGLVIVFSVTNGAKAAPLSHYEIAFDSDRTGHMEIHVMNGDGSNIRQVTNRRTEMADHDARWIPGQNRVAFQSYRRGGWRIWSIGLDGKDAKLVTNYGNYEGEPHWNPTGDKMLFTAYRPAMNIMLASGDGRVNRQLTHNRSYRVISDHPRWTPDGRGFLYVSNEGGDFEIYHYDLASGNTRQLTFNNTPDFSPTLSATGHLLAYLSERNGVFDTYVLNLNTGKETRVSSNPDTSRKKYNSGLMEGSSSLTSLAPAWSPDGAWLAYFCFEQNNAEICVRNWETAAVHQLTKNSFHDGAPSWRLKANLH